MRSLKSCKKKYQEELLSIHWRQWTALGIFSTLEQEKRSAVDLEALFLSTIYMGIADKRLLTIAFEWILKNREWINLSRINRIARRYITIDQELKRSLVSTEVLSLVQNLLKSAVGSRKRDPDLSLAMEAASTYESNAIYHNAVSLARRRKTAVAPGLQQPCLIQLFLRGIFGINARAELLLFLLEREQGNSSSIAREIGFDQKIVYRLLEQWNLTGLVEKTKDRNYRLRSAGIGDALLPYSTLPRHINWINGFHVLNRIHAALDTPHISEDRYLLASFFRDILPDARALADPVDHSFSDERLYQGEEYCSIFMTEALKLLDEL